MDTTLQLIDQLIADGLVFGKKHSLLRKPSTMSLYYPT